MVKAIISCMALLCAFSAAAECTHPLVLHKDTKGENVYVVKFEGEEKKVTCESDWLLLADFGREKEGNKLRGLVGNNLSHSTPIKKQGWKFTEGTKFFDPELDVPDNKIGFYKTSEAEGRLSIDWPQEMSSIKMSIVYEPMLLGMENAIHFVSEEGINLLWSQSEDDSEVTIDGLDQYGDGELVFVEQSGVFIIDEVWIK